MSQPPLPPSRRKGRLDATRRSTTTATNEELERIREMRARRKRAEEDTTRRASASSIDEIRRKKDDDVIRSEIEARLAERRRRRSSAASTLQASAETAADASRKDRRLSPRSNSHDGGKERTTTTTTTTTIESSRSHRRASTTTSALGTEPESTRSHRRASTTSALGTESYSEWRKQRRKSEIDSKLPPRSKSNDISERLRERREAREKERREREKKYDLKEQIPQQRQANEKWSLKLCVISAKDLPPSVVPNLPLCLVLKMGLVPIHTKDLEEARSTKPKLLSKRDNGCIDFHQEYRWDDERPLDSLGLCIELTAKGVTPPLPYESPRRTAQYDAYALEAQQPSTESPSKISSKGSTWSRSKDAEMETAEAAAVVARMLVDDTISETPHSDYDVTLGLKGSATATTATADVRVASIVIPLEKISKGSQQTTTRFEQWHRLTSADSDQKNPSVLLEISLSKPEVLDESEDELEDDKEKSSGLSNASFFRRASIKARTRKGEQETKKDKTKLEDPILEPGIVDFVAVVGCKNIGNQKHDGGMKGWVKASPECVVLEQFPPDNEFHAKMGRKALLPEMVQWFCYPEGTRLWRGTGPPSHIDLELKRFSASSPANVPSSIAAFDACLGCTTSFSWFVIASNSDEYGSSLVKTYGAVIRFYVPAPTGIDPTQDDFAQAIMGRKPDLPSPGQVKRLWVPIAICLTSNLPIVGVLEALLLRVCEELSPLSNCAQSPKLDEIQKTVTNLVLNYQKPIAGAVNCSIPFLDGDRFLLSLPPKSGLPALPHGRSLVSVCRLLGADGLNYLIAAVLTECKILLHSEDIADLAMVAEVITALTYPFTWSLPYIPVLPIGMIEFVEAPLSYLLGIPTCNLKTIDPHALDDTVVVNLNKAFSVEEYSQSKTASSKHPAPLPASVATKLSNAVYKLLRDEEEMEAQYGDFDFMDPSFPRLEDESLAEREFRVTVAIEICGLLRGYQDCVGAVFNRDKFLKTSPALFEEKNEYKVGPSGRTEITKTKVLSSRSKRFLSSLVSGQNFQQLLESLDSEETSFFHEILDIIDDSISERKPPKRTSSGEFGLLQAGKNVELLMYSLQKVEDKIPTFCVNQEGGLNIGELNEDDPLLLPFTPDSEDCDDFTLLAQGLDRLNLDEQTNAQFFKNILSPIEIESTANISDESMQAMSMEYLAKLETDPWQYNEVFNMSPADAKVEKIKLREAIGEKRFRAWKLARDKNNTDDETLGYLSERTKENAKQESAVDLAALVTSAKNDTTDTAALALGTNQLRESSLTPAQQRIAAAKSRDIIRRCLDRTKSNQSSNQADLFVENGRDLMAEAEKALRNPSAQAFLISILSQRSRLDNKRSRTMRQNAAIANSASRLNGIAFDCLVRLSCAMLDSCMEYKDYEMAYQLLTNSAGFIMVQVAEYDSEENKEDYDGEESMIVITMTSRIGLHPIFADVGVWEAVMAIHLRDRKAVKKSDDFDAFDAESDDGAQEEIEYEAAVATLYEMVGYGIPGEELSRFAMRVSQENGWFIDDTGRQLLMLARRISIRRDQADTGGTGHSGDIDMVRKGPESTTEKASVARAGSSHDESFILWNEIGWCHPSAPTRLGLLQSMETDMKRTPVTTLASFGPSLVASGGLDGGVFLAHMREDTSGNKTEHGQVRGIHLDWGSASRAGSGASSDGEYGVGAVSCLAATDGDTSHNQPTISQKDTKDSMEESDIIDSMEGCRIVAGTTAGDLRVWSVKDIYSSLAMMKNENNSTNGQGASRLKYSLRGRALSGHRGGVTCIDVPSQLYRPDSLVTGGADGMIKLWALRAQTGSRRANSSNSGDVDAGSGTGHHVRGRGGDALHTLNGHTGRVLCIKTAWHGDHLLSGGADRSIRVWDLAAGSSKCIHTLFGHFGWITKVEYWGPNTIVSASTDRSVALWDARVRSSPLFVLRNHQSPISDLLVGSRTDPYMVSAATDGTIATWDFRSLSDTTGTEKSSKGSKVVRTPSASIQHSNDGKISTGPVHLARDVVDPMTAFWSVSSDAILRKWDISSGAMLHESSTGHYDGVSNFQSYGHAPNIHGDFASKGDESGMNQGFLTSSMDGTVRLRKPVQSTRNN